MDCVDSCWTYISPEKGILMQIWDPQINRISQKGNFDGKHGTHIVMVYLKNEIVGDGNVQKRKF